MLCGVMLALMMTSGGCESATGLDESQPGLQVTPGSVLLQPGSSVHLNASLRDRAGNPQSAGGISWSSSDPAVVTVDAEGNVTAVGVGLANITVTTGNAQRTVRAGVFDASDGDFVVFPSPEIEFIVGPQLTSHSRLNPWPWFDSNAFERGLVHGAEFANDIELRVYYDQALVQYTNYFRTGDDRFLSFAREIADATYALRSSKGTNTAPRSVGLSGIMLRALDGKPEYWPWIKEYGEYHLWNWIERRYDNTELWYGVRDGAYATLFAIQLSRVHPDSDVRADLAARTSRAVEDYWAKHQNRWDDGGWYWNIDDVGGVPASQPFQVGLVAEALIAHHKATSDPNTAQMIARCADWLYNVAYDGHEVSNLSGARWRAMKYFVVQSDPTGNDRGSAEKYGRLDGGIEDARQLNSTTVHAFGYAFKVTGDVKYLEYGDDVFSATFGRNEGPGADGYSGLAYFRAKEYNQSYRASGRYLVWRLGG